MNNDTDSHYIDLAIVAASPATDIWLTDANLNIRHYPPDFDIAQQGRGARIC